MLASRAKELDKRIAELQKNLENLRIGVAQRALECTRNMLREAGGPSERRLTFAVLDADEKIRRAEAQLAKDKCELQQADEKVREALALHQRVEAQVLASEQVLENSRARHAHLAFQVAVEAGRNATGYDELASALAEVEAHVVAAGNGNLGKAQARVSRFVRKFKVEAYSKADDPVLQEVASVGSQESIATTLVDSWQEAEAAAERRAVEKEGEGEVQKMEGKAEGLDEGLEKVCVAAASAAVHVQICDPKRRAAEAYDIASSGGVQQGGDSGRSSIGAMVLHRGVGRSLQTERVGVAKQDEDMPSVRKRGRSLERRFSFGLQPPMWAGEEARKETLALCKWSPPGNTTNRRVAPFKSSAVSGRARSLVPAIKDRSRTPGRTG